MKNSIMCMHQKELKEVSGGTLSKVTEVAINVGAPILGFVVAVGSYFLLTKAKKVGTE